ncbi:MAG: hypothetical protein ACO2PN_11395, partial [Pyrobaculum sp.]
MRIYRVQTAEEAEFGGLRSRGRCFLHLCGLTVAERMMSLYMVLSCWPICRGRHVHGLRDAVDGGDRR